jgi:hypothetical protein
VGGKDFSSSGTTSNEKGRQLRGPTRQPASRTIGAKPAHNDRKSDFLRPNLGGHFKVLSKHLTFYALTAATLHHTCRLHLGWVQAVIDSYFMNVFCPKTNNSETTVQHAVDAERGSSRKTNKLARVDAVKLPRAN